MKEPVLVVMAAGMGSRYGGLKQIDPVDQEGHIIMDFSIYDAVRAGFKKVIFIIKKENEQDFRDAIGDRLSDKVEIVYVHQDLNNIPEGFQVPEGRVKPWGTGHAVLSCSAVTFLNMCSLIDICKISIFICLTDTSGNVTAEQLTQRTMEKPGQVSQERLRYP